MKSDSNFILDHSISLFLIVIASLYTMRNFYTEAYKINYSKDIADVIFDQLSRRVKFNNG
jgi:hypothetical protein